MAIVTRRVGIARNGELAERDIYDALSDLLSVIDYSQIDTLGRTVGGLPVRVASLSPLTLYMYSMLCAPAYALTMKSCINTRLQGAEWR